ncbi:MAG: hypothetical protein QGI45_04560 [Myxococcota bacterium]|jgi:hypothetical protein|nr:hypothetical protein [Myxococcota bacterium]
MNLVVGIFYLGLTSALAGPLDDTWTPVDLPVVEHDWTKSAVRLEQREGTVVFLKGVYAHAGRDENAFWGMPLDPSLAWWLHTHAAPASGDKLLAGTQLVDGRLRYPVAWLEREEKLAVVTGMLKLKLHDLDVLEVWRERSDITIHKVFKRQRLVLLAVAPGVPLLELVESLRQNSAIKRAELDLLYHFARAH